MAYIGSNPFAGFAPFTVDSYIGDGTTVLFALSQPRPVTPRSLMIIIDGVTQPPVVAYGLDGNRNLLFTEAPPQDSIITIVHMQLGTGLGGGDNSMTQDIYPAQPFDDLTFDGTNGPFQLRHGGFSANPYNAYYTLINVDGQFKRPLHDYTIDSGGGITFIGTPPAVGSTFYGLDFGKITISDITPGSVDSEKFATNLDFGTRDVRINDPVLSRQLANKNYVDSAITTAVPTSTSALPEGSNLYYTNLRARTAISGGTNISYDPSTGIISTNLPSVVTYMNQRVDTQASPTFVTATATTSMVSPLFVGALTGDVTGQVSSISNHNTDQLTEGTSNLYFTNQRAQDGIQPVWIHNQHIGCDVYRNPTSGLYEIRVLIGNGTHTEVITNISNAIPAVLTTISPHGFIDGDKVTITDVLGMTEVDGQTYYLNVTDSTHVELYTDTTLTTPLDSTAFGVYTSGGFVSGGTTGGRVLTNTDQLPEGLVNKYFTLARFLAQIQAIPATMLPKVTSAYDLGTNTYKFRDLYLSRTLRLGSHITLTDNNGYLSYTTTTASGKILKTTDLEEDIVNAAFFTTAKGRAVVSAGTGLSYSSTSGVFTNTDLGSSQNIYKNFVVGATTAPARSNSDTITFVPGSGISLALSVGLTAGTNTLTVNNTGIISGAAGTGISVSTTNGVLTISNAGLIAVGAGVGINVSSQVGGSQTITNTGILAGAAGSGITVSTSNGVLTIGNSGIIALVSSSGIGISVTSGTATIQNTGVVAITGNGAVSAVTTAGTTVVDLKTVSGLTAGTYNSLSVDTQGRVTAATSIPYLTANQTITLSGDATGSGTTAINVTLANTAVTANTYGSASKALTITVDSKGRLTAASATDISITASQVSNFSTAVVSVLNSTSIDALSDVNTTTVAPVTYDLLYWNGTYWKPGSVPFGFSALGNVTGNTILDARSSSYYTATATGATTFFFTFDTNSPVNILMLELTNGGSQTIVWPTSVKWPSGVVPALTTSGVDILVFISHDSGTTWRGAIVQQDSR